MALEGSADRCFWHSFLASCSEQRAQFGWSCGANWWGIDEGNVEPLSEIGILSVSIQMLRLQIVSKCVPDFCTAYIVPHWCEPFDMDRERVTVQPLNWIKLYLWLDIVQCQHSDKCLSFSLILSKATISWLLARKVYNKARWNHWEVVRIQVLL